MMKLIESKANKSGEPNIVWRENSQFWLVKIRRRGKTFTANARTIEDAVKIRDRAMKYFDEHNEFPTRQQIQANYKTRNTNDKIEYYCTKCRKTYLFRESGATAKRFMNSRHVCVKCRYDRFKRKDVDISGIRFSSNEQIFKVDLVCKDGVRKVSANSMKSARRIKLAIEEYVAENGSLLTSKEALALAESAKKNIGKRGNRKS